MERSTHLQLLGVSFRTAPVAVREALSFDADSAAALLRAAAADLPGLEAMVVSTCNRTEFYLVPPAGAPGSVDVFLATLRRLRPDAPILRPDCPRHQLTDTAAAQHLMRVACGLDSQIIGDGQILGQVRAAIATARTIGTLGPVLDRLTRHAVRAGKRARTDTPLGRGAASVGSALASMLMPRAPKETLVIGAGDVARDVSRHLAKHRLGLLQFVNRTRARAATLAQECGGRDHPWGALEDLLLTADVVVAATAARQPILDRALLDRVLDRRGDRPLLVIDAGMPRNVEAGSRVTPVDIDHIREQRTLVIERRQAAIPAVEDIMAHEIGEYERWRAGQQTAAVIQALYGRVSTISREAADQLAGSQALAAADIERVFLRSFKRLMHEHVRELRGILPVPTRALAPAMSVSL